MCYNTTCSQCVILLLYHTLQNMSRATNRNFKKINVLCVITQRVQNVLHKKGVHQFDALSL